MPKKTKDIFPTLALPKSGSRVEVGLLPLSLLSQAPLFENSISLFGFCVNKNNLKKFKKNT